jgi:hypothetical protein
MIKGAEWVVRSGVRRGPLGRGPTPARRPELLHSYCLLLLLAACTSAASSVCQDIANCTAQTNDQESTCEADATDLGNEAYDGGCGPQYDGYLGCASNAYYCSGATPEFPGCATDLDSLDSCLETERASNACGALQRALSACAAVDAGPVPAPCGVAEVCAAECYLTNVANPCAPQPVELSAIQSCQSGCP